MKKYTYVARTQDGQQLKGVTYADDKEECIQQLRKNRLYPIQIRTEWNLNHFLPPKKIPYAEIGIFCKQFSALLQAGITLPQALLLLHGQKYSPILQALIDDLIQSLEEGESLYQGVSKYKEKLPPFFCSLIKAGEMTNRLDSVFERLAAYYDQEDRFRKQLQQLMVYPLILLFTTMGVVAFLFFNILPGFSEIYQDFDAKLPFLTYCLLTISGHLITHIKIYLIGFSLLIFSLSYLLKQTEVKQWFGRFQYQIPFIGGWKKQMLAARLARTWSLLLANGLEVLSTVELTLGTISTLTDVYLQQISLHLRQGITLTRSVKATAFFPEMFVQMIAIGEESGTLPEMLARVAQMYENEGRTQLERLFTILEPALLMGIALIVGLIVLAVMLPMFDMIQLF